LVEFGFTVRQVRGLSFGQLVELVKQVEAAGFDAVWMPDSQLVMSEAYVSLAVFGLETKKVKLGCCATNPFTRDPTVIASAISTINILSQGRAEIAFGAGETGSRPLGYPYASTKLLEKVIEEVRLLTQGKSIPRNPGWHGNGVVRLAHTGGKIPIYLACTGPKMLQLAGRICDGVILNVGVAREAIMYGLELVYAGAESKGRDKRDIKIGCEINFCLSEDKRLATNLVKPYARMFATNPSYAKLLDTLGLSPRAIFQGQEYRSYGDLAHLGDVATPDQIIEEGRHTPDEIARLFSIAGTVEDFLRKIRDLEQLGIDFLVFKPFFFSEPYPGPEGDQSLIIKTFGESIIPAFR